MGSIRDATDAELVQYRQAIETELARRATLRTAEAQSLQLNADYLAAAGVVEGQEWRQPTSAVDAYPAGWRVTHAGTLWESTTPANVWEPGVSGWREVTADGSPPEWVAPTGAHDAYQTGDRVTYRGQVYRSLIDGNTWSPTDYPAGWEVES
ncbi:hypothetical protein NQ036_06755 [Brevibacterium sp. 91QC2O2]|uniref:carbohydrate-binding protein n=1 Tax=Brevibacterium sp. 91QC2O2 TaxID=2968458 RepID=UPI00211C5498|nr:carbohydrate-binding protein [Brevibacterium sp. 91QC2O2]MCQ9367943.1 hypothetical protein [Brevibacterium sp. 91QC2O2]